MSTLEHLDEGGSVKHYGIVPWKLLHDWLSEINGNAPPSETSSLPKGVNRGKILEELEARRVGKESALIRGTLKLMKMDRGIGKDWREYESQGLTHLEELLVFQPKDWRKQAREYFFRLKCNLTREGKDVESRTFQLDLNGESISIFMGSPILVVLFHPRMTRSSRYEPLNFLLAYGVQDPLPVLLAPLAEPLRNELEDYLSPLDYFLQFQNYVTSYRLDLLCKIGKDVALPRLSLIKELDFADIIGQRLAKQIIRQAVVSHMWNRSGSTTGVNIKRSPLSMIFAGPSGNGKTELAHWLADLMNKPSDDFFLKIDCGKLTHATEIFGLSGAYQGAEQGSALNNFVLRLSSASQALGIVLLDEIEKASRDVIHGLYQVIDKGEWTNKLLTKTGSQTEVLDCSNLIFIMTTNATDTEILDFVKRRPEVYDLVGEDFDDIGTELATSVRKRLQSTYPFTDAFLGRVGRIVPFLPIAKGNGKESSSIMHGESMALAKLFIERQQEKLSCSHKGEVQQLMTCQTKHKMAKIVVEEACQKGGVRAILSVVEQKMSNKVMNALLLEEGGIDAGSHVQYYAREDVIDFRVQDISATTTEETDSSSDSGMLDLFE